MWYSFFVGGFCAAVALADFLERRWFAGMAMSALSILNVITGVVTL